MAVTSNFAFIAAYDDKLAQIGALAEAYFRTDPVATLTKLRVFAEFLSKLVATKNGLYIGERETFEQLLRRLADDRILTDEVPNLFHFLRRKGNAASHDHTGTHGDAFEALKIARQLAVWFHRTYGDPAFKPGPFIPPREPVDATADLKEQIEALKKELSESQLLAIRSKQEADEKEVWEQLAQDVEAEKAEIALRLAALQAAFEKVVKESRPDYQKRGKKAAAAIDLDEASVRALIDQQLREAGWEADSLTLRYGQGTRPVKGRNLAIAEWPTARGCADYALFCGTTLVGVVEAKRQRKNVSAAIDQAQRYSEDFVSSPDFQYAGGPWGKFKAPFVFAANGRPYLKQLETESGIWFRDVRRGSNLRRALVDWSTPKGLESLLQVDEDASAAALKGMPFEFGFQLRYYQEKAIKAVEDALGEGRRSMLLAMATGTGKTKLAIAMLYRLLATKRFRSVCFVVDRSTLGDQAAGEFTSTKIVSGKTFAEIFGLKKLEDIAPDTETKIHICTIQGLLKRVIGAETPSDAPPIDQYDLLVVDECHRGYLLDREMSDSEMSFRSQEDYVSKYRRVLDYFDAVKIGLTATPAIHTTDIFGDPIFKYSYREAVIDGFLIDHEPPIRITTALAQAGIKFEKDEEFERLNTITGEVDLTHAADEFRFEVDQFNKKVITPEFNRVVAEVLAQEIDLAFKGKTLIFAATDGHADIVVHALKTAFAEQYGEVDDAAIKKLTGSVDGVRKQILSFKNDSYPQIAVTVDLLTTGVDVPKITNLVFLRRVNSRILYEQMIGRATRRCDEIGKEVFRIFDAVDLYPHIQNLTEMKPVVVEPSISIGQLIKEMVDATEEHQRETIRDQLIVRLRRRLKGLSEEVRQSFESMAGETPEAMLKRLREEPTAETAKWLSTRPALAPLLDWKSEDGTPPYLPISTHGDQIISVTHGYGDGQKPEDYLSSFAAFVRDNQNTIAALKLVVQRPRDLKRSDLKELRMALDQRGFTDQALRRAWADAKNEEIAASIIGFVRQAALGDPLIPYSDRVQAAIRTILASRKWTSPQKTWLEKIGKQIEKELVVDREAIDSGAFERDGGFKRLNKVFNGELETILADINDALWKKSA